MKESYEFGVDELITIAIVGFIIAFAFIFGMSGGLMFALCCISFAIYFYKKHKDKQLKKK